MSLSLYELSQNYRDVLDFEVKDADDAEAMIALLDEAEDDIELKIAKIGHVIKTLEYEAKAIREEEKALADKRKARENKQERLKAYLFRTMIALDIQKVEQIDRTVRIQKNPPALKVLDVDAVPPEWWIPQDPKLDMAGLKDWVKNHGECDFAYLEQTASVRIA